MSRDVICIPRTARYVVRNQAETAEDAESTSEHQRIQQYAIFRFFPDFVVFDGFIQLWNSLFTRKQNTRAWRKADVGISHQTENEKEHFVYAPDTYISPFVVAIPTGANSNPSSREYNFQFLET